MPRSPFVPLIVAAICLIPPLKSEAAEDVGPFIRALWLVQSHGTPELLDSRNDQKLKGRLVKALGKDAVITVTGATHLMDSVTFEKLAGADGRIDGHEVTMALEHEAPWSRKRLKPEVVAHANMLTTSFDLIDETHCSAGDALVGWIVKNLKPGQPLHVTVICTGNSRRSVLGPTMGNIAAAYYGMPEIQFHSGGTLPTAVNPRTIATLKAIGMEIEPTGTEAPRGEPKTANPLYKLSWGQPGDPQFETTEFSKSYFDASNPRSGFAALMICGEADEACPLVKGASIRISMPYLDPKIFDGSALEALKYAERRDDMGRLMLSVMMRVRNVLNTR